MQEPSPGFQKESLMFQKIEVLKKRFTIIEILLSGAIGLLLLFVMANAFINFQKMGLMQNNNVKKMHRLKEL